MNAHQYVQQPNQISSSVAPRQFFDTDSYANTFGVAPNYGCCATNMHAGFPLFAGFMALRHDKGFAFPVYGACTVRSMWEGEPLEIIENSSYPFDDMITFTVTKAKGELELHFRPISNTDFSVICNGKPLDAPLSYDKMLRVPARQGDIIELSCTPKINIVTNPDGSKSIRYGNLLMALGLTAKEVYIKGKKPYHDRGFVTDDRYDRAPDMKGYLLIINDIIQSPIQSMPFSEAPVKLIVTGRYVQGFRIRKNSAYIPFAAAQGAEETTLTLVPYGTTRLRISHFPLYR